jgi:hypothetical protein
MQAIETIRQRTVLGVVLGLTVVALVSVFGMLSPQRSPRSSQRVSPPIAMTQSIKVNLERSNGVCSPTEKGNRPFRPRR